MKSIKLNLDEALHRRLKARAAMEGTSMQDLLVKLVEKHLANTARERKA